MLMPSMTAPSVDQQSRIDAALERIGSTPTGRGLTEHLASDGVEVQVLTPGKTPYSLHGAFDPIRQRVGINENDIDGDELASVLAHEARHASDIRSPLGFVGANAKMLGSAALAGATSLAHGMNPVSGAVDALEDSQQQREVDAFMTQAQVAHELGMPGSRVSPGQRDDGSVLPAAEVRAEVEANDGYVLGPGRRLGYGAIAVAGTAFAGTAVDTVLSRFRPSGISFAAVGGLLASGSVAWDQLRHRDVF